MIKGCVVKFVYKGGSSPNKVRTVYLKDVVKDNIVGYDLEKKEIRQYKTSLIDKYSIELVSQDNVFEIDLDKMLYCIDQENNKLIMVKQDQDQDQDQEKQKGKRVCCANNNR